MLETSFLQYNSPSSQKTLETKTVNLYKIRPGSRFSWSANYPYQWPYKLGTLGL